jgi:imidazolonepropionase-like amidohydrolase
VEDYVVASGETAILYRAPALFDSVAGQLLNDAALVVADGRVAWVGPSAEAPAAATVRELDGVVVPGFVDSHSHITLRPGEGDQPGQRLRPAPWQTVRGVQNLRRMVESGVTTMRSMGELLDIDFTYRDAVARGEVTGPRLRVCGPGLTPPGAHGSVGGGVAGVDDLRVAVRERAAKGADHIKIFTTGGVSSTTTSLLESNYSPAEIAAIVGEAADHGLTVSAHAHGGPGVTYAVENGIHSIEHGEMLTGDEARLLAEHGTWLVMTHTISHHPAGIEAGDARRPEIMAKLQQARAHVAAHIHEVREAGLRIAVGTDSMHGLIGYEMVWLVEHGWTPAEALQAGTVNGAELMGLDDIGVLKPGARADFVVLGRDPLQDITAVYDVKSVWVDGTEVVDGDWNFDRTAAGRPHLALA